ncbi:MAG TPA: hypothetical protein VFJ85_03920 [Acidimicrobiales bacterium]|nr:hypothetical protein [Acidimicrobiales bacterium]
MRPRSIVITIVAGVTAIAGPAAAMEFVAPPRPHVTHAAEEPAPSTTVAPPATTAPAREHREPVTTLPAPPPPAPTTTTTVATPAEPAPQVLKMACAAGHPDGLPAVRCEWSAAAGAARYLLVRKAGDGTEPQPIWSGRDLNHVDRAVVDGTGYGYAVKALDAAGRVVGGGGPVSVRCCGDVPPPPTTAPKPAPLPTISMGCTAGRPDGVPAVRCEWAAAAGAARYTLYRKSGDGTEPQPIWSGTDLNHVDKAVVDGAGYGYAVKAVNGDGALVGVGGPLSVRCCGDVPPPPPPAPVQTMTVACVAGRPEGIPGVSCQWGAVTGAGRYQLYRKSGDGTEPQLIWSGTDLNHLDRAVVDGAGYAYAVKALNGDGAVIGAGGPVTVACCPVGVG